MLETTAQVHVFGKGMSIAVPQIGIGRAAAIVRGPDGEAVTLLNPRVIEESPQTDEQYEGCRARRFCTDRSARGALGRGPTVGS